MLVVHVLLRILDPTGHGAENESRDSAVLLSFAGCKSEGEEETVSGGERVVGGRNGRLASLFIVQLHAVSSLLSF